MLKLLQRFSHGCRWFQLKNHKIEMKLLLTYPLLIIVSITVVSVFAIYFSMFLFREKSQDNFQNILKQISYNMDTQLKQQDLDTYLFIQDLKVKRFFDSSNMADSPESVQLKIDLRNLLTNYLLSHSNIERIVLINNHDEIVSNTDEPIPLSLADYHQAAARGDGKMVWMKTQIWPENKVVIPVLRQIKDLSTLKNNGVLLLFFKEKIFKNSDFKGNLRVLEQDNYVISSNFSDQIGSQYSLQNVNALSGSTGSFVDTSKGMFFSYYKSEYTYWTYLFSIPTKELYSGIEVVRNWVIVVAILFTIIGILLAKMIASNISKPLIQIIREMRNIETNDLSVNLNYDGNDELTSLAATFNNMMNRIRELIERDSNLQRLKHELEMRALQAEINPHFLYNTLEAINWIGRMNKVNEICDITAMLADIMRYSIDQSKDIVTIQEEYEHTQKYTGIQRIRYADNLSFFMDLPKEMLNVRIPKLTLQPLVENAILHGFENKREVGKIKILGIVDEEFIKIRIEDNGCGMTQDKVHSLLSQQEPGTHRGIGIYNVHQRIRLLFGEGYGLSIRSEVDKGTSITITLPLNEVR
ncbi:sensor histidine kinase [Paenibacillus baimaensis]|nr:sensor histidine kinase [Paenibacillus sp. WQ 127069]